MSDALHHVLLEHSQVLDDGHGHGHGHGHGRAGAGNDFKVSAAEGRLRFYEESKTQRQVYKHQRKAMQAKQIKGGSTEAPAE